VKYDRVARHHIWFGSFNPAEQEMLLTKDVIRTTDGDIYCEARRMLDHCDSSDVVEQMQSLDARLYLAEDILTKVDRASMAVSLEVRAPLLDHHLMELIAKIPSSLKLRGRTGKYIFKKAMAGVLPPEVLNRRKQGFAVPLATWFRTELRDVAHAAIFSCDDGILDESYLKQVWDEHQRGTYDRSAHLWSILMYRKWCEAFQV